MNPTKDCKIASGELWQRLIQTAEDALAQGALHRIETRQRRIDDGGIPFVVRVAINLQRKAEDKARRGAKAEVGDPFAPPEPPLTVGALGEGHIAVLNKYNVVDNHLLIVTRHYEPQEALLTAPDFQALCWCLREVDGLGFYNGGAEAGASQHHKHLQLVPCALSAEQPGLPIEQLLSDGLTPTPACHPALPFRHRIAALPPNLFREPATAAEHCRALYQEMLNALNIATIMQQGMACQSAPYNLLLTRRWIMLVPRTGENFEGISINAMGFVGSLFVLNEEDLARVESAGPVHMLKAVSAGK